MKFENYTVDALKAIILARRLADSVNEGEVQIHHILLALLTDNKELDTELLSAFPYERLSVSCGVKNISSTKQSPNRSPFGVGEFKISASAIELLNGAELFQTSIKRAYVDSNMLLYLILTNGDKDTVTRLKEVNSNLDEISARLHTKLIVDLQQSPVTAIEDAVGIKLSERGNQLLALAWNESMYSGRSSIGTDQILIALVRQPLSSTSPLPLLNVSLAAVRAAAKELGGVGRDLAESEQTLTPSALSLLTNASKIARRFNHSEVAPEHILLALCAAKTGIAKEMLSILKVDVKNLETKTTRLVMRGSEHAS